MQRKHYHVLSGLKGCYMPDMNLIASSKREAIRLARIEANIQNAHYDDERRHERLIRQSSGFYANRLFCIEVTPACYDTDCKRDD